MGGNEDRGAARLGDVRDQRQHRVRRLTVQVPGRLIRQNHCRIPDQRPRHGDALLLPTRQLPRQRITAVRQAHLRQQLTGFRARPALRDIRHERELDILQRTQPRHQVERLEDETHSAPMIHQSATPQTHHLHATDPDRSLAGGIESSHQVQQRGLPRPRGPHQRHPLGVVNDKIHPAKSMNLSVARTEALP